MKNPRVIVVSFLLVVIVLPVAAEHYGLDEHFLAVQSRKQNLMPFQHKFSSNVFQKIYELGDVASKDNSHIIVQIQCQEVTDHLLEIINHFQGEVLSNTPAFGRVTAALTPAGLEAVAQLPTVRWIRSWFPPQRRAVRRQIISEGVVALNTSGISEAYGIDGTGINVGVISDDILFESNATAAGDLPTRVHVLPDQGGLGYYNQGYFIPYTSPTGEGTGMLEIVYNEAPGAGLYFATAGMDQAAMGQNIISLFNSGCTVIVDDVSFTDESPLHEGSPINQAIQQVFDSGAIYLSAAGNDGHPGSIYSLPTHWEGPFNPLGSNTHIHDAGGEFSPYFQLNIALPGYLVLWWSDPLNGAVNDYDLSVWSSPFPNATLIGSSAITNQGQEPTEYIDLTNFSSTAVNYDDGFATAYVLITRNSSTTAPRYLHLSISSSEDAQISPSSAFNVYSHSAFVTTVGIGAVPVPGNPGADYYNYTVAANPVSLASVPFNQRLPEDFTSDGPRLVFYDVNDTQLTNDLLHGGINRTTPNFAGVDGVSTAFFATPFFGTSAAAPSVAAMVALLLSYDLSRTLTPSLITTLMAKDCIDIGPTVGFDYLTGYGVPTMRFALDLIKSFKAGHYVNTTTFTLTPCPTASPAGAAPYGGFGVDVCFPATATPTATPTDAPTATPTTKPTTACTAAPTPVPTTVQSTPNPKSTGNAVQTSMASVMTIAVVIIALIA